MLDRFFLSVGESGGDLGGSVMTLDMELLIRAAMQWVNVVILSVIMFFLLYKPVKKFLADRAARINNDIESARFNNEQTLKIKENYKKMLDDIDKEREEILSEAYRVAVKKSDQILFDAQEEAKYLLMKAKDEIKMEHENATDEIKKQIIEISALIASRLVEVSVDRQTQDKYIDEALADWGEQG